MSDLTALTGKSGLTKDEQELYKSFLDAITRIIDFAVCPKYANTTVEFNEWIIQIRSTNAGFLFMNSQTNHFFLYERGCLSFYHGKLRYEARNCEYRILLHLTRESYEKENKCEFISILSGDSSFIYEILRINEDLKLMLQKLRDSVELELESFTEHAQALQKWITKIDKL